MKEINDVKYFNILEIKEFFTTGETEESIRKSFETGELKGKKIGNKWFATKEEVEDFIYLKENLSLSFSDPQKIDLKDLDLNERVLDIGGGGEGVIGQLMDDKVVSIDLRRSELEEAVEAGDNRSLKIIMDAKDLKFLDESFSTITAFFSLMYMPKTDHKQIFTEIYRVLKKQGEFLLWELNVPENLNKKKNIYAVPITIQIKHKKVKTGYGVHWNKTQDITYFLELAKSIGFEVIEQKKKDQTFFLRLKKA